MLRKLKWQLPVEPLAAWYNWCQGPVPGRGPVVEKQWFRGCSIWHFGDLYPEVKVSLSSPKEEWLSEWGQLCLWARCNGWLRQRMNIVATYLFLLLQPVTILRPCTNEWPVRGHGRICRFVPHAHELVLHSPSKSYILLDWSGYIYMPGHLRWPASRFVYINHSSFLMNVLNSFYVDCCLMCSEHTVL